MRRKGSQGTEDADVVLVVRAELKAVALGDFERHFERVDGVEPESGLEERRFGIDVLRSDAFQVERLDDEFGELALACRLRYCHARKPDPFTYRPLIGRGARSVSFAPNYA